MLSMLLLMNIANSQQWSIEYSCDENEYANFIAGDMSSRYNYVLGAMCDFISDVQYPLVLCIDENGNYTEKVIENGYKKGSFVTAVGLGDGNAFVAALYSDNQIPEIYEYLWVAVLNPQLDVIAENKIKVEHPYISYGMSAQALVNDDNEIVMVSKVTDSIPDYTIIRYDMSFYKFGLDCNLLKQTCLENPSYHSNITSFIEVPNTDYYAMFSDGMHASGAETVSYIDDDLNYISTSTIDNMNNYHECILPLNVCVDYWYDEHHFLMSAKSARTSGTNDWYPLVVKKDTEMNVIETLSFERVDTTDHVSQYRSMACINPDKIYVSTFWQNGNVFESYPNTATVFLINDKLDLLGRKDFELGVYANIFYIQPTNDEGCLIHVYLDYNSHYVSMIYKLKSEDFEIITDVSVSGEDFEPVIYPNPVSSILNVNVGNMNGSNVTVTIVDMIGRRYLDKEVFINGNTLTLDVSSLSEGTYFYSLLIDGRYVLTEKFVKK